MDKNSTPHSITQDILKYLEEQELFGTEEALDLHDHDSGLLRVRSILDQIIDNIENRAQLIEEFQAKLKAHNQYPLFDLSTIIPDFFIDEEMYNKLAFREILVISSFQAATNPLVPKMVGGLVLDIQTATGRNPLVRKDPGLEQKIVELLTQKINASRKFSTASSLSQRTSTSSNGGPRPSKASSGSMSKSGNEALMGSEQELQEFEASIKPLYKFINSKFLVHLSSQFDVSGKSGGSRITAWVDRNFHTLEEKRTEYINEEQAVSEKTLYCALQPRRYYVKHKSTLEKFMDRKYYSMAKTRDLICEGANFLLMRYLAIVRYIGSFELSTMYINGDMCHNFYECFGPESGIVNEQKLDLCKIYRRVTEECGITHHCVTILTLSGQIVKQEWEGCDYVLQVNPIAHISNEKPGAIEHLNLRKAWESDMQLLSQFLDRKTTCSMQIKSYVADHPELKNMMADYIQSTLLMKPDDILDFTIKHFTQYYPYGILKNEYTTEEEGLEEEFSNI